QAHTHHHQVPETEPVIVSEPIPADAEITTVLDYANGTLWDADDDGVAYIEDGVVDLTVENTQFSWDVDESHLCAKWTVSSVEEGVDTIVCNGAAECCVLAGVAPEEEEWDNPLYVFHEKYGSTETNVVTVQVLYVDQVLEGDVRLDTAVGQMASREVHFFEKPVTTFSEMCVDSCVLPQGLDDDEYVLEFVMDYGLEISVDSITYSMQNLSVAVNANRTINGSAEHVEHDKVKADFRYDAIVDSAVFDNETGLFIVVFHHDSPIPLPLAVRGRVNYTLDRNESSAGENVTLTIYNWNHRKFRIIVGSHTEVLEFGEAADVKVKGYIKNSQGQRQSANVRFIDTWTEEEVAEQTGAEEEETLEEGEYNMEITLDGVAVHSIHINEVQVYSNLTEFVNVEDVSTNRVVGISAVKSYAIDPTAINFTNATVTVTATGTELYKCAEWNFAEQSCGGEWSFLMDVTPGENYTFTLTPDDPALAESNGTFFEGFESGSLSTNGWTTSGSGAAWTVGDGEATPYAGSYSIWTENTDGESRIETEVDTTGYSNIAYSFYAMTNGLDAGEYIAADWYNGTGWTNVLNVEDIPSYTVYNYALPASASNNSQFMIRFRCSSSANNEACDIDNVQVTWSAEENDTTAPATIEDLDVSVEGETWLYWTWNNPDDVDFDHTEVWLDGVFKANVSTAYYNTTGLEAWSEYIIQLRTADSNGNINTIWVNNTATTERADIELNGTSRNANSNNVNMRLEIINQSGTAVYNQSGSSHNPGIKQGHYRIRLTPSSHVVKSIDIQNITLQGSQSGIIDLDDPDDNQGYSELYAINPVLNFTNATVTVTATGNVLHKCADWNYTQRICSGSWVQLRSITLGQDYTFTITPDDPGFAESEELFFEGFESGSISTNNWTTSGLGSAWTVTDSEGAGSYAGSYSAYVENTVGESIVEKAIDTTGYENIVFSFYAVTGGMDPGEYIAAEWYDGTGWTSALAETQTIPSYTAYNYSLPAGASNNANFRIRFRCSSDSNNEDCNVDNVKVDGSAIDSTSPGPIANLALLNKGTNYIYWVWTNPVDSDFDHSEIYLNGVFKANTSNEYYYATGLNQSTQYTVSIRTVDTPGNFGQWANDTQTTDVNCTESWVALYEDCRSNDTRIKYYNDTNGCGTNNTLPGDNGMSVSCDYVVSTNFNGTTTNFVGVDLSDMSGVVLEIWPYGTVLFLENITIDRSLALDTYAGIGEHYVSIDSSQLPEFNRSANITLYNLSFVSPRIMADGAVCANTTCTLINYSEGIYRFNVTHWTNYSVEEGPYCGDAVCNGDESCSSCALDCGSCSAPSSPGGGGGGGGGGASPNKEVPCEPDWQCYSWGACSNNQQSRKCFDANACDDVSEKPETMKFCVSGCAERWTCGEWGRCTDAGIKTRSCRDLSKCGTEKRKPVSVETCDYDYCSDEKKNNGEEGVDCGGSCNACTEEQKLEEEEKKKEQEGLGNKLTGQAITVQPYDLPNPVYIMPLLLLLALLVAVIALHKANVSARVKKIITCVHTLLIIMILLMLLLTFDVPEITGQAVSDVVEGEDMEMFVFIIIGMALLLTIGTYGFRNRGFPCLKYLTRPGTCDSSTKTPIQEVPKSGAIIPPAKPRQEEKQVQKEKPLIPPTPPIPKLKQEKGLPPLIQMPLFKTVPKQDEQKIPQPSSTVTADQHPANTGLTDLKSVNRRLSKIKKELNTMESEYDMTKLKSGIGPGKNGQK
ncbi:hypothetical protein ACFL3V_03555, partial [Nanoarchaeota archaeon]